MPLLSAIGAVSFTRSATSAVPVLLNVRPAALSVNPVAAASVPASWSVIPVVPLALLPITRPPITATVPVVALAAVSVSVLPAVAPALTRLSEPLIAPANVPVGLLVVRVPPVPVMMPPLPVKAPAYWLFAPRSSVPPLTVSALFTCSALATPSLSVPLVRVVPPV